MNSNGKIAVIGAGLAGCEAALQLALRDWPVDLYEMRPLSKTPAHQTGMPAELVCSNSLKALETTNAHGLLKEELERLGSFLIPAAKATALPAGGALAVDKALFSQAIEAKLASFPQITRIQQEVSDLAPLLERYAAVIVASGPLTSPALHQSLNELLGAEDLYFYDAIAPIVNLDSVNLEKAYFAARYGKGTADYLNCPMNEEEYHAFVQALVEAEKVPFHNFEEPHFFEGCMPIEVMAARGPETLSFGPMKPVGLEQEGQPRPYAVLQLRQENAAGTLYNLVGCQTRMTYPEQRRVFRMVPGLENAEFARLGSMHRNSYVNAPRQLTESLATKKQPKLYIAGQLAGVEGYVESMAMGLWAGLQVAAKLAGQEPFKPDGRTLHGALVKYLVSAAAENFQPMNANFGLLQELDLSKRVGKGDRKKLYAERALGVVGAKFKD